MSKNANKLLDTYNKARQAVFDHVGYVGGWVALPLDDRRNYWWRLDGEGPGAVAFAKNKKNMPDEGKGTDKDGYSDEIYTQRHLPKWVYRGAVFTMVVVDTHTDGNRFLAIFDNAKELPPLPLGSTTSGWWLWRP